MTSSGLFPSQPPRAVSSWKVRRTFWKSNSRPRTAEDRDGGPRPIPEGAQSRIQTRPCTATTSHLQHPRTCHLLQTKGRGFNHPAAQWMLIPPQALSPSPRDQLTFWRTWTRSSTNNNWNVISRHFPQGGTQKELLPLHRY